MKRLLFILLFPTLLSAQFSVQYWYATYDQRPYASYSGIGCRPHLIDWTGVTTIVHFDNENVNDTLTPYWEYVAGTSAVPADSIGLFHGPGNDAYNYVDSLVTIGHRYNIPVVMTIMVINTTRINNLMPDSSKIDSLCQAIAQWCELYDYDGVDLNYEGTATSRTNMVRFLRLMRQYLDAYVTPIPVIDRPRFSITGPTGRFIDDGVWVVSDTQYVDFFNLQIGTAEWDWWGGTAHRNWFGSAVRIGTGGNATAYAQSTDQNLPTISEDSPWTGDTTGLRLLASRGWPKSYLGAAYLTGGGNLRRGSDTVGGLANPWDYSNDNWRALLNRLLAAGGEWHWDSIYQASYISGTATAETSWPVALNIGEKFFVATADSINNYVLTTWLLENGYGGVAPYSVAFDFDSTVAENAPWSDAWKRLPGHSGIIQAVNDFNGETPPAATNKRWYIRKR